MRMPLSLRFVIVFTVLVFSAILVTGCAGLGGRKEPRLAPDVKIQLIDGSEISLSDFRGKPLVIGIGATWCPHCLHEARIFKKVYDKYEGRVQMLGIIMKSPQADAEALVRKTELKFKIGVDPDGSVAKALGVHGIPQSYFITADGMIVDDNYGGIEEDDLVKKIEWLLGGGDKTKPQ